MPILEDSGWTVFFAHSWKFPHEQMVWKIPEYFLKKSFEASPRCIQKWHVWDLSRRAKLIHISREILPKNSEKAVSSKSCWKETAGTIVNISHTWAEKLKIISNPFFPVLVMKEDMCEGTDADKGVLAQKTELPGIYPDLLAPLMMMTVLKMMTMAMMMMTMLMMNSYVLCKNHETVFYAIQGFWLWTC